MNPEDFHTWSRRAADWSAEYMKQLPEMPVRAQTQLGEIAAQVAEAPPENAEPMETIFNAINDDGRIYLTQSIHEGKIVIRFQAGTHACTEEDVAIAWQVIQELAANQQ